MAISSYQIKKALAVRNRILAVFGSYAGEKLIDAAQVYEVNNQPELAKVIREGVNNVAVKNNTPKRKAQRANRKRAKREKRRMQGR